MEALFIFLILLLGLVLCYFLGDTKEGFMESLTTATDTTSSSSGTSTTAANIFDNYDHYTGTSTQLSAGNIFYGQNGTTAVVVINSDGSNSLQIILPGSSIPVIFTTTPTTTPTTTTPTTTTPTTTTPTTTTPTTTTPTTTTTYYGPDGKTATIINDINGQLSIQVSTSTGTYYYYTSGTMSNSNTYSSQTSSGYDYSSSLPQGISGDQIPYGQDDLYILKTNVVPPVCPMCPSYTSTYPRQEPCPACPACSRCPESSSNSSNSNNSNNYNDPTIVLNDYTSFGM